MRDTRKQARGERSIEWLLGSKGFDTDPEDGKAWDDSLSERDPGWIRYMNGERYMEREER